MEMRAQPRGQGFCLKHQGEIITKSAFIIANRMGGETSPPGSPQCTLAVVLSEGRQSKRSSRPLVLKRLGYPYLATASPLPFLCVAMTVHYHGFPDKGKGNPNYLRVTTAEDCLKLGSFFGRL